MDKRYGKVKWGKGQPRQRTSAANWKLPLKWNKTPWICNLCGTAHAIQGELRCGAGETSTSRGCEGKTYHRARVFCASLSDWLDDEVPVEWLADLLQMIHDTPNLDWQNLTKRPENFFPRLRLAMEFLYKKDVEASAVADWIREWIDGRAPANIWLGVSVEDQKRADERIPALLRIPAKVRFLSVEPLLGEIDLGLNFGCRGCNHPGNIVMALNEDGNCSTCNGTRQEPSGIHWCIIGGESGRGARPCNVEWIRSLVGQCKAASVAVFVKQLGSNIVRQKILQGGNPPIVSETETHRMRSIHPKGGDMDEWPEDLRVREFP